MQGNDTGGKQGKPMISIYFMQIQCLLLYSWRLASTNMKRWGPFFEMTHRD
jgi:hypothetical protein